MSTATKKRNKRVEWEGHKLRNFNNLVTRKAKDGDVDINGKQVPLSATVFCYDLPGKKPENLPCIPLKYNSNGTGEKHPRLRKSAKGTEVEGKIVNEYMQHTVYVDVEGVGMVAYFNRQIPDGYDRGEGGAKAKKPAPTAPKNAKAAETKPAGKAAKAETKTVSFEGKTAKEIIAMATKVSKGFTANANDKKAVIKKAKAAFEAKGYAVA